MEEVRSTVHKTENECHKAAQSNADWVSVLWYFMYITIPSTTETL